MKKVADYLVIGSGIAGLSFAIHAAQYGSVIIVTKKHKSESNTNHAQGGIACVLDPQDSFKNHINDTLTTGGGLSDEKVVRTLVKEGPSRIKELIEWGANFNKSRDSKSYKSLHLGREGGHSHNRIVHANDLTGRELENILLDNVRKDPRITIYENHSLVELITSAHIGKKNKKSVCCYGAYIFESETKRTIAIRSKVTYLATGGVGQVYAHTTNPSIATGDGIACAYRAGAKIANMEFIQFHPTTLYHKDAKSFLISEAIRGHGAVLINSKGERFMDSQHHLKSLAPRDIVARAIDRELKKTGQECVYLDIRHKDPKETKKNFPTIFAKCKEFGIDITKDLIPVVPASHYLCGGVNVDINGRTSIKNLYAGGEVANTGVHGANRLASNSLLEALVFSKFSARSSSQELKKITLIPEEEILLWDDSGTTDTEEWILIQHNLNEIRTIMWNYVGIVRSDLRLKRALRRIKLLERETEDFYKRTKITPEILELRNIVVVSKLIVQSALKRKESRGLHYTTDYPARDDKNWKKYTTIKKRV